MFGAVVCDISPGVSQVAATASSLSRRAYEHLVGTIFRKELAPGDTLNRRQVAEELGISVAPVLEAMVQLEAEGFLVVAPRKATRVRPLRAEDFRGQLIVRMALECQVARMCCGRAVRSAMTRLMPLARGADAADRRSPEGWRAEMAFHLALAELAGCEPMPAELERTMRLGHFLAIHTLTSLTPIRRSHVALLKGLRREGPDQAERIMRDHLVAGREAILAGTNERVAAGGRD